MRAAPPWTPRSAAEARGQGDRHADHIGDDRHQAAGHRLHRHPEHGKAYFNCVNANGGVNGHPVKLFVESDQTQPAQVAAAAKKLIQSDHVVGIVGIFDHDRVHGRPAATGRSWAIYEMDAGIAPECWSTPNSAAVNMGPRYSSDGAVQYAISPGRQQDRVRPVQRAGHRLHRRRPGRARQGRGRADRQLTENVPINDANSVAIKLVNAAGPNGSVVLNFTPPEALVILQAAQKLGLEDRVKGWGCSTPCNTDFLAKTLGPKWNHKLFVNAELTLARRAQRPGRCSCTRRSSPSTARTSPAASARSARWASCSAKFAVHALQNVKGAYTIEERQRGVQGDQGLQDRHALPAVDVRRATRCTSRTTPTTP